MRNRKDEAEPFISSTSENEREAEDLILADQETEEDQATVVVPWRDFNGIVEDDCDPPPVYSAGDLLASLPAEENYGDHNEGLLEQLTRLNRLTAPFDAFCIELDAFPVKAGTVIPTDESQAEGGLRIELDAQGEVCGWRVFEPPGGEGMIQEITAVHEDGEPMDVASCLRREGNRFVARFDFALVAKINEDLF